MESFFVQKKTVIIEAIVLVLFLGGMYYLYVTFTEQVPVVSTETMNEELLGQDFVLFLKAVNQDRLSFREMSFMNSALVGQLRDYSEMIGINETRGRTDPFVPYAPPRPIR